MQDWIAKLYERSDLTRMGHHQRSADLNLGLGWIYYGLARVIRPRTAVVIGSHRGFVPLVIGKALSDNGEGGEVLFIDPSLVDDFWKDAQAVRAHFAGFGVTNVRHFLMTTQEFAASAAYRSLGEVGLVFVDGFHSAEQAQFDYETFKRLVPPDGVILFHDSLVRRPSRMYGPARVYDHSVYDFVDTLRRDPGLQVFDLPFASGLTLVRKVAPVRFDPIAKTVMVDLQQTDAARATDR